MLLLINIIFFIGNDFNKIELLGVKVLYIINVLSTIFEIPDTHLQPSTILRKKFN